MFWESWRLAKCLLASVSLCFRGIWGSRCCVRGERGSGRLWMFMLESQNLGELFVVVFEQL